MTVFFVGLISFVLVFAIALVVLFHVAPLAAPVPVFAAAVGIALLSAFAVAGMYADIVRSSAIARDASIRTFK